MRVYDNRSYDDGQILFDRTVSAFAIVIRMLLKAIVYSPLLFISGLITKQITGNNTDIVIKLALIIILAIILYYCIYFLKGVLIALKYNQNLFWVSLFLCCVLVTCVLPVWIIFEPLQNFITSYVATNAQLITWIFAIAFGLYVYSRYHFLTNIAQQKAFPYYQRGIIITNQLLNLSKSFKGKKSTEVI